MPQKKPTILYIAGAKPSYPRNANALAMLRESFTVCEITSSLNAYWQRFPVVMLRFIFARKEFDAVYVGFMGHPIVFFVHLFTRKPIIFDAFISLYDSICFERKSFSPSSLRGRLMYWIDKYSCHLSDVVILDTHTHADWFVNTFQLPPEKLRVFLICADPRLFKPFSRVGSHHSIVVEFHGGFIPLQGVEYIIRAVKLVHTEYRDVTFHFLGIGRDLQAAKDLTRELKLRNIIFHDYFAPIQEVPRFINDADIALGIFGTVEKTAKVIPNKLYEAMACRKPVISADTVALREIFHDEKDVLMCEVGNPHELAHRILRLIRDTKLRERIARAGYARFKEVCDVPTRTTQLSEIVSSTLS
jgi:glycosyltransferase involved in cell wall biosynthesis